MSIRIEKLIDKNSKYFPEICEWQINWWGEDHKREKVIEWMECTLNKDSLPATYIAIIDDKVVGMYQIAMDDRIDIRPNYYPWILNVYVDENNRGKGICAALMERANKELKELGFKRAYLHSKHINLYEKFGWKYLEEVETLKGKIKRIFYLDLK